MKLCRTLLLTLAHLILGTIPAVARADDYDLVGALAFLSQTGHLAEPLDYNLYLSSTYNFTNVTFQGRNIPARDTQLYVQPSLSYRYSPHLNFGLGYAYQKNNPLSEDFVNENRIWQQVLVSHSADRATVTHRFRYEERFIHDRATGTDPVSTRVRYQVAGTVPLQGSTIDPGEFYVTGYNEFYFSLTGARNASYSENWTYLGIGYLIPGVGKVELGPMYQTAVINKDGDRRNFLVTQIGLSTSF
jgi:hypothetical protein